MRVTILIPGLFAAAGAFWLTLSNNPRTELQKRISRSRDRVKVEDRLVEIGRTSEKDFEKFRNRQLLISTSIGILTALISLLVSRSLLLTATFGALIAITSYIVSDRNLTSQVRKQRLLVDSEFPAIIEMYSLAMSAGETPLTAMERISNRASGTIAREFHKVILQVRAGRAFHLALDEMGRGFDSILIRRFVDSLIIATLRGAPVIDVLQRHAQEARESQRNRVLGAAAKAEISMMIPVVFLILPISILFALWPSLTNLNIFAGT